MARPKIRGELKALNINIDADIAEKLSEISQITNIPKTAIVERALKEYFAKHNKEFEKLKATD